MSRAILSATSGLVALIRWSLTAFAILALAVLAMLASPLSQPPALASIQSGAMAIGGEGRPDLSRFQARDGSSLAYRLYPAKDGRSDRLAILIHGSSGSSAAMHQVARALAEAGVAAVAVDMRGHGASGTRGDIGYIGELDDDLADLIAEMRHAYPVARLTLIGHSSGGGFALRIAGEPQGGLFDRIVLLAPYLGHSAPTNRSIDSGDRRWADVDLPRLLALAALRRVGVDWAQSMPVIAFAVAPAAAKYVTARYSYRLLSNFGPPEDWQGAVKTSKAPIEILAGEKDELMNSPAYPGAIEPLGANARVTLLAGVDHMGMVYAPAALAAVRAAVLHDASTSATNAPL
jgi:pimeloyl-ACP methyl ester carboxylesterase